MNRELLSRGKYKEEMIKRGESPFTLEIENDHQSLFYFGANHSRDPNNHQYPILRKYWRDFLDKTEGRDRIVLVEGILRIVGSKEEESIQNGSEGNVVTMWARDANIPIACPEPNVLELLEKVKEQFSIDELAYYLFAVAWKSWFRLVEPRDGIHSFVNYISRAFDVLRNRPGWEGYDWSMENMRSIHKKLFGVDFDENIPHKVDITNPNIDDTVINKVARAESDIRDAHITSEIERYWKEGKSILIVFGAGHLIIQEPALRELLK